MPESPTPPPPSNPPPTAEGRLQPGTLLVRLEAATQRGLDAGELLPLKTHCAVVEDAGICFRVHVLEQLQRKDAAKAIEIASKESPRPPRNPFLPYEPALFVADLSDTHVAVLNKYNVLPHHMLIITRAFAPQTAPLNEADLEAMGRCLQDVDGLGFFNGGEAAGASQPHKHLQLVLLPMHPEAPDAPTPLSPLLNALPQREEIQQLDALPYAHGVIRLPDGWWHEPEAYRRQLLSRYQRLLQALAPSHKSPASYPYNWLLTRRWMMIIPRRCEFHQRISVNSLGFVGGMLVRTEDDLALLQQIGPMRVLQHVAHQKQMTS